MRVLKQTLDDIYLYCRGVGKGENAKPHASQKKKNGKEKAYIVC
jgi:hypothetical protein